jgi:ABC-2 type transport system permease protein
MNIFIRELKANFKSLVIWSVIVTLFVAIGVSKFSAYYGNPEMLAILDAMPPAMMEAFSMNAFNLTTLSGFFGVMFVYFALMLSIAAAMWGTDIISKEERDKTVEFALTLPVTRSRVVTAKALAAVVNCIALLLVTWAISLASSSQYNPDGEFFRFLALCMGAIFILQLIFLAIGILLGCAMNRYKRTSSVAVSLLLGAYVLSVVSGLHKNLEFLKYVTPFKYFDAGLLLRESRFDLGFVALSAAIILVSMVGAYLTYNRRDLYI